MSRKGRETDGARTKEEIIVQIERIIEEIKSGEGTESTKSVKSHMAFLKFAENFLIYVRGLRLPELVSDGWEFSAEITETSANLYLQYVEYEEDEKRRSDGYVCTIYEIYNLVNIQPRMLTVEDYAQLHEVNVSTVRQWIRRGKIRKAQKFGKEWRIPEFVEPVTGRYPDGIFVWRGEKLNDLLPEYSYLNDYDELGITQISADKYKVGLMTSGTGENKRKLLILNTKDRERLELMLISNPFVTCLDGRMNFSVFDDLIAE